MSGRKHGDSGHYRVAEPYAGRDLHWEHKTRHQRQMLDLMAQWSLRALCREGIASHLGIWDSDYSVNPRIQALSENSAKAICAVCPVLQQCRDHALEFPEPSGIWGGLNEDERRAIRAERRIA